MYLISLLGTSLVVSTQLYALEDPPVAGGSEAVTDEHTKRILSPFNEAVVFGSADNANTDS